MDDLEKIANLITEDPNIYNEDGYDDLNYRNISGPAYSGGVASAGKRYSSAIQSQTANPQKLAQELQNTFKTAIQALKTNPQQLATYLRLVKTIIAADTRTVLQQLNSPTQA